MGLGGMQDHITYYKNAKITARNDWVLYSNFLTGKNTLAEYQVTPHDRSVCFDGAEGIVLSGQEILITLCGLARFLRPVLTTP